MAHQQLTDNDLAKTSLKNFRKITRRFKKNAKSIEFATKEGGLTFQLPVDVCDEIEAILKNFAEGKPSEVLSDNKYMTTQQAADYLDVSRPFVVRLLDSGDVPFKKVGRHRRVLLSDLKQYEKKQQNHAMEKLHQVAKESQLLNLY